MKYIDKNLRKLALAILILLVNFYFPNDTKSQDLSNDALIYYEALSEVTEVIAIDQIRQLEKSLPCFKGEFKKDAKIHIINLAKSNEVKNNITNILKRSLTEEELISLAKYYNTDEGKQVLEKFAKSINNKNDKIWKNHDFFKSKLGTRIVDSYPIIKRNFKIEGGAFMVKHLLQYGDLFLQHINLDGSCK